MARAFKFLKSTSVSWGAPEEGEGAGADNGGVVLAGDAAVDGDVCADGVGSSCAIRKDETKNDKTQT